MAFTARPELLGSHAMVASTHWLASTAAFSVLERGGNAADAAATAGFVLQVVEPHLNGLGGEVPILVAGPDDPLPRVICGQGPVPAAATPQRLRDLGLDAVPGSGLLAACVPGAFDAWMLLLRDHGTLRPAEVLAPAVALARAGHPLLERASAAIAAVAPLFREHWPSSAAVYLDGGAAPQPGARLRNPDLAASYERLAAAAEAAGSAREAQVEAAREAFAQGPIAAGVDAFLAGAELLDGSGVPHRGLLSGEDMAAWRATVEPPVVLGFGRDVVCKPGPWSQGPVLLEQLALLGELGLRGMEHNSAAWVHTIVEAAKLAFADREAWLGDPAAFDVPIAYLLDPGYAAARAGLVEETASLELRPGAPGGRRPRLPRPLRGGTAPAPAGTGGEPSATGAGAAPGDTCHVAVVDAAGMMVSATPSGGWLQSSPVIPGLGFCLGTRAQMTWLEEGLASSLRGGRRPRTTLSPTMVMRDGRPCLALGSPGGDMQDQWSLRVLVAHLVAGLRLQEAVEAASFHSTHFPSSFQPREAHPGELVVEDRHPAAVLTELRRRGHRLVVTDGWSLGRVCAVARDADGTLHGAADARGAQAYAIGR